MLSIHEITRDIFKEVLRTIIPASYRLRLFCAQFEVRERFDLASLTENFRCGHSESRAEWNM